MKLVGGSIEKGKERLAQFFIKHDAEITQEQAAYLANFTMTLLTDVGGRMLFHQVAAKGFNKVRRRGWEWLNDVVGFGELSELLNIQMNGVAQV